MSQSSRSPRPRGVRLALVAVLALLGTLLQVPAAQAAPPAAQPGEIGRYGANYTQGAIDPATGYMDYTFVNALTNKTMMVNSHTIDNRQVVGQELYDNTALRSGAYTEIATNWSDNADSSVSYTWLIQPSDLRVTVKSTRYKDYPDNWQYEVVTCQFTRNGQVVTDAPFSCAVQFKEQGQYGHLTEYVVIKDANPEALPADDTDALISMVTALCQNSNNGNAYPIKCSYTFPDDSKAVFGYGLPVTLVVSDNCGSLPKTDSVTNTTGASSTSSWNETTTIGAKFTYKFTEAFAVEGSVTQAFSESQSWTLSTTDSTTYQIPSSPGTRGVLELKYPIAVVKGNARVDLIGTSIDLKDLSITYLQPGAPQSGTDEIHLGRVDCPNLPVGSFKFPPVN